MLYKLSDKNIESTACLSMITSLCSMNFLAIMANHFCTLLSINIIVCISVKPQTPCAMAQPLDSVQSSTSPPQKKCKYNSDGPLQSSQRHLDDFYQVQQSKTEEQPRSEQQNTNVADDRPKCNRCNAMPARDQLIALDHDHHRCVSCWMMDPIKEKVRRTRDDIDPWQRSLINNEYKDHSLTQLIKILKCEYTFLSLWKSSMNTKEPADSTQVQAAEIALLNKFRLAIDQWQLHPDLLVCLNSEMNVKPCTVELICLKPKFVAKGAWVKLVAFLNDTGSLFFPYTVWKNWKFTVRGKFAGKLVLSVSDHMLQTRCKDQWYFKWKGHRHRPGPLRNVAVLIYGFVELDQSRLMLMRIIRIEESFMKGHYNRVRSQMKLTLEPDEYAEYESFEKQMQKRARLRPRPQSDNNTTLSQMFPYQR